MILFFLSFILFGYCFDVNNVPKKEIIDNEKAVNYRT